MLEEFCSIDITYVSFSLRLKDLLVTPSTIALQKQNRDNETEKVRINLPHCIMLARACTNMKFIKTQTKYLINYNQRTELICPIQKCRLLVACRTDLHDNPYRTVFQFFTFKASDLLCTTFSCLLPNEL